MKYTHRHAHTHTYINCKALKNKKNKLLKTEIEFSAQFWFLVDQPGVFSPCFWRVIFLPVLSVTTDPDYKHSPQWEAVQDNGAWRELLRLT